MTAEREFTGGEGTAVPIERRVVSRKTPADGKLEIAEGSAQRLGVRDGWEVEVDGSPGRARLTSMACTCAKAARAGSAHEHHFLESDLFRSLRPESEVEIALDGEHLMVRTVATPAA